MATDRSSMIAAPALSRRAVLAGAAALAMTTRATATAPSSPITAMSAVDLAAAIRSRKVSSREVMDACLAQIERHNPGVNAIVSLVDADALRAEADILDREAAAGRFRGPLHGFPHAVKDLAATRGIRTTYGSPLFRDLVPQDDAIAVARLRRAGAILIGKTNVPEFGLGSQSYNPVFGVTGNAYDPSLTAGGSSGGAAVALAMRMVPLADGSDFAGSLRNPAGWNNVFGFRPSPGRVPALSADGFFQQFGVEGPMARTVRDLGLLLSVQAGYDDRAPLSLTDDPAVFAAPLDRDFKGRRIGWLGDLGGTLAIEPGVLDTCQAALQGFRDIGMAIEEVAFPMPEPEMWRMWLTLRHWAIGGRMAAHYRDPAKRALLKPEAIWEIEGSLKLTGQDLSDASAARTTLYQAFRKLFERYDFLVLPTAQTFPFAASLHWPKEIAGRPMDTYHRWMEVACPATLAGCPAMGVPAGFGGPRRLPIGLQILGPNRHDLAVLQVAHAYEQASPWIAASPPPSLG